MESQGNFLQNDTKFVQIPQVVMEILQIEMWQVLPFYAKKSFEAKTPILVPAV